MLCYFMCIDNAANDMISFDFSRLYYLQLSVILLKNNLTISTKFIYI